MSLLATGSWGAEALSATLVPSTFLPDAGTTARVEAAWATACARPGVHLFDGPLCRLERIQATPEHLHVELSAITYRWFYGTNGSHPELAPRADALGSSAALVSSDGWLVFGVRSQAVGLYPGRAHPFGGTLDPTPTPDLLGEMARELDEEIGLKAADIAELLCIGIGEDPLLRQPELLYLARTHCTRKMLVPRLQGDEHGTCWCVATTPTALTEALADPLATPVTRVVLQRYRELLFA
jgi:hypothetical protein